MKYTMSIIVLLLNSSGIISGMEQQEKQPLVVYPWTLDDLSNSIRQTEQRLEEKPIQHTQFAADYLVRECSNTQQLSDKNLTNKINVRYIFKYD